MSEDCSAHRTSLTSAAGKNCDVSSGNRVQPGDDVPLDEVGGTNRDPGIRLLSNCFHVLLSSGLSNQVTEEAFQVTCRKNHTECVHVIRIETPEPTPISQESYHRIPYIMIRRSFIRDNRFNRSGMSE